MELSQFFVRHDNIWHTLVECTTQISMNSRIYARVKMAGGHFRYVSVKRETGDFLKNMRWWMLEMTMRNVSSIKFDGWSYLLHEEHFTFISHLQNVCNNPTVSAHPNQRSLPQQRDSPRFHNVGTTLLQRHNHLSILTHHVHPNNRPSTLHLISLKDTMSLGDFSGTGRSSVQIQAQGGLGTRCEFFLLDSVISNHYARHSAFITTVNQTLDVWPSCFLVK